MKIIYRLFCAICGMIRDHTRRRNGDWEIYSCPEGHEQHFRVK